MRRIKKLMASLRGYLNGRESSQMGRTTILENPIKKIERLIHNMTSRSIVESSELPIPSRKDSSDGSTTMTVR